MPRLVTNPASHTPNTAMVFNWGTNRPVRTANGHQYYFFIGSGLDLYWTKTTDGGKSWSQPVAIDAETVLSVSIWYDRWTPGNTGNLIHIAWIGSDGDDVFYRALDTSGDSLGTEVTVFAGTSTGTTRLSMTVARGGNIYVMFDIDAGTEKGFYRSTDSGASFGARSDASETADLYILAPGFAADNQDIICLFWDADANEISRKLYDDSADSWSETSVSTGMAELALSTGHPSFSITVTASAILLAAWNATDGANADLKFWTITEAAITAGTDIVANGVDDQGLVSLALDTRDNTIYAFYGGKSDGSDTFITSITINYKRSTDGGTTWSAEIDTGLPAGAYKWFAAPMHIYDRDWTLQVYHDTTPDRLICLTTPGGEPRAEQQIGVMG